MLKKLLPLFAIMPMWANADKPLTQQDLLGKWECKGVEYEYFHHTSDIEFRDDGILSEKSIIYKWGKDDDFYQIDTIRMLFKYRVMGDKVVYYDGTVQSYAVDMPNLNDPIYEDIYDLSRDELMNAIAMREREEFEKSMADNITFRIRFIDKDTYISAFEGIDEDFPTDIDNNHCKRKL